VTDEPLLVFGLSFPGMWVAAYVGRRLLGGRFSLDEELRSDYSVILGAALTLLGLIVGFSFSVATGRYDQRKNYEQAEANAIGTEYLRADLLPPEEAAKAKALLKSYLDQRIQFYETQDEQTLKRIDARTIQLEEDLWSVVLGPARAQPTQVTALAVSGMNDVLSSQGQTQSAWWYRVPTAAWALMVAIAAGCNVLVGYGLRRNVSTGDRYLLVLPLLIATAFMLIAEIDAPRHGFIRIIPLNLTSLADSLK
jgi:hypothetical protein